MDALVVGYCHYLPFFFTGAGVLELDPAMDDRGLRRSALLAFAAGLATVPCLRTPIAAGGNNPPRIATVY